MRPSFLPSRWTVTVLAASLAACASVETPPLGRPLSARGTRGVGTADEGIAELPDLSGTPPLSLLLETALHRSPSLRAARERANAAAEGAAAEAWLPNPQVMIGWYETSVETRVGPQRRSLSVTQAIPFPTKLGARARIEDAEARRMAVAYERSTRDVLTEVVRTAHEIAYIDEATAITADIAPLLERYVAAAADGTAGTPLPELFRAETQRAQLDNDRVVLRELREAEAQHLRSLLDLPPSTAIGTPRTGRVPDVDASFADLLDVAERHSQELVEAGLALEAAEERASLAGQSHLPDLMLGVTSIATERLDHALGMDPDGNGDDPLIFSVGVSVPLWVQRDLAVERRAGALRRAAAAERAVAIQSVRDRLAQAWYRVGNAERLHRLYARMLVPRAELATRTAEDLAAAGKGSRAGALETIAVLHNFRLAAARARADHGRAVADLERVLGRPLTLGPGGEEER